MKLPAPFYPIASDEEEVALASQGGVKFLQLRFKGAPEKRRKTIQTSLEICRKANIVCVINDYWQEALNAGAEWIHLGQEDLDALMPEDHQMLVRNHIKIGISTHDKTELKRSLSLNPAYIALGPIWKTTLKKMKWHPQGVQRLRTWRNLIPQTIPLVAIGGLTPERGKLCCEAGADAAACVSAVFKSDNPLQAIKDWNAALA